jgi:hypothetical protein
MSNTESSETSIGESMCRSSVDKKLKEQHAYLSAGVMGALRASSLVSNFETYTDELGSNMLFPHVLISHIQHDHLALTIST